MLTLIKKLIINILNLKLVILLEYQNIKIFLKMVTLQISLKKILWLKKCTYVINDHNGEVIVETFYKKGFQKSIKEEFRTENVIKRKGDKLNLKRKGYNNSFNS